MLAGLNDEERTKLRLNGYNISNLNYLNSGDIKQDESEGTIAFNFCNFLLIIPTFFVV